MSDDGVEVSSDRRNTNYIPHACESAITGVPLEFSVEEQALACRRYETFHQYPKGDAASIEQVIGASAGIQGYLAFDPDLPMRVGQEVCSSTLCGLWAKKAISAVSDLPEWERVILTVDSGVSETVVPPDVARNLPLLHTSQVGTEYEAANGGVVVNLGEKRADIITKLGNTISLVVSFQIVKVHKPLLAMSRLVEAGHKVHFDKDDPHILFNGGEKVPTKCRDGTYEIDILIRNPICARPTRSRHKSTC